MFDDFAGLARMEQVGSPLYQKKYGILTNGAAATWTDKHKEFPESDIWDYLDSAVLTNNSAQPIEFSIDGGETYYVLPYQMQPVTRRPITKWAVKNVGAAPTVANEVILQIRRLGPDVQTVTQVR